MSASRTLVFFYASPMALPCLSAATRRVQKNGYPGLNVRCFTKEDLLVRKQVDAAVQVTEAADAVVFIPHGEPTSIPGFARLKEVAKGKPVFVQPLTGTPEAIEDALTLSSLDNCEAFLARAAYLHQGGTENHVAFLRHLLTDLGEGDRTDLPPAQSIPFDGIYHPEWDHTPDLDAYLAWARERQGASALVLGLWFYQGFWLNHETAAINAIIREVERQGGIVLPVFHRRFPDPELGNPGAPGVVERYFRQDGKVLIDALLSPVAFSLSMYGEAMARVYPELGVPVFQMIATQNPAQVWRETVQAVSPIDVSISAAQPEFDGALITTVHCTREVGQRDPLTGGTMTVQQPIPERIAKIVSLARNWGRLRRTPVKERKIAIIFHHYPPRNDTLGSAFGLDSFESVNRLLARMQQDGYDLNKVWENGEQLAFALLDRLTNDRRYLPPEKMAERTADTVPAETVKTWHEALPTASCDKQTKSWGAAPGSVLSHNGEYLIGGLHNGNVFLGLQPIRGKGENDDLEASQTSGLIHDPDLPPPHHYLGYYRWIKHTFGAHAVMHIGKHGTLEWLPGKSLGLSEECFPDLAIQDLPNIYPYIINNPGEGTQAKRRSAACIIDHLIPPMTSADKSDKLREVEELLETYYDVRPESPGKAADLLDKIWTATEARNLHVDLGLERGAALAQPDAFIEQLHDYLNEVAVTAINDGLHILGQCPEEHRLIETLAQYLRLPSSGAGSLWEAVARSMGYEDEDLRDNPGEFVSAAGKTKGQIRAEVVERVKKLLIALHDGDWKPEAVNGVLQGIAGATAEIEAVLRFVQSDLYPRMERTREEIDNTLRAAAGDFIPPGGSGSPTRGAVDILPTGRNFYSVDPQKLPTPEAWDCGVRLGNALVARYLEDEGKLPEQIGITIWASQTMRTRGDDIAEVFYLMGLKPVWHVSTGRITGLEVIPLEQLKHPRLDITLRTSGLFRDAFPNLMEWVATGVDMVAALKEPPEANFLARNVAVEQRELELAGVSPEEAQERARYRVFSCKPGAYGTGTDVLLENKQWQSSDDLGEAFVQWGAYAYRPGVYGKTCDADFRRRLGKVQLTVKNEDSREHDILIRDDWVIFQGGMNAAVKALSGEQPRSYSGDASDPRKPKLRSTAEEARFIFRARILNPKWIEGCKRHGYKGAAEFSHAVDHSFEWDATSNILDDWQYEELANTYALDPAMQEFLKDHNPWALQNIAERLLEAIERQLWENPGEFKDRLQAVLLDSEGEIEDRL